MSSNRWSELDRPPLAQPALAQALTVGADPAWRAIEVVENTGSTNADVAARARAGAAAGLVIVADHQEAGRGRLSRNWTAPPRSSLAVSVLLRPLSAPDRWGWLPLLAGVALIDSITTICGLPVRLKWPNDVLVPASGVREKGGQNGAEWLKLCGVLAEVIDTPQGPAVVLGAGINVSQSAAELPVPTATSLRLVGSACTDRDSVLRGYLRALAARYGAWQRAGGDPRESGLGAVYREMCLTIGRQVRVELPAGAPIEGEAQGVDDDGRLLVRVARNRIEALAAGDVVHVLRGFGHESGSQAPRR